MPRFPLLAILFALAIGAPTFASPALADTSAQTPPKKKPAVTRHTAKHAKRWATPPGYRTPAQIERAHRDRIQRDRRAYYRAGGQRIYYWSDPNPRFYRGQWNGGSFGPCYTWTPIGAVWNCGK
jgi:hypothetical protein